MPESGDDRGLRTVLVGGSVVGLVAVLALVAGVVVSCDRGVAERVATGRLDDRWGAGTATSIVVRRVPAPQADAAEAVADPRCRSARRLFLRAAIDPNPLGAAADVDLDRLLDQVEVLAEGPVQADIDAVRALARRIETAPGSITRAEQEASVDRMERLLVWTVTTCPAPQRPVWGCAAPIAYGRPDLFDGPYFLAAGQLVPDEAVIDKLGEPEGQRIELARNQNHVVYAWTDGFGLVRRRVEVQRVFDLWFVTDARRCDEPMDLVHPLDVDAVIVEELPDAGDGPEYATTTTTTTTVPVDPSEPAPVPGCRYDPRNLSDPYESLGEYMATGPAEPACWELLSAEGRSCVNEVTAAAPSGNPEAEDLYACFDV
jgi:hypothetical protein